jgi:hypothetical protein
VTILKNREIVHPHVVRSNLDSAYAEMARDHNREKDALEWAEITFKTVDMAWPKEILPT